LSLADTHRHILISGAQDGAIAFLEHTLVVLHNRQALM
jgi:hypothetical protein